MSEAVLSQLQTAVTQLSGQESDLATQLIAIQEQRKGLQTVIEMFEMPASSNGAAAVKEVTVTATPPEPEAAPESAIAPVKKTRPKADTQKVTAPATKSTSKRGRKPGRKPKAQPESTPSPAKATRKPRSGKAPNWSRYIQEPFKKTPLPDVVANILKAQPNQAFKIADVMEVIFKSDIPKTTFLKARNRVSNILSAGARTGEWTRGRGGRYSLSEKALGS
ncbi:MAG: hypothetical protein AAFU71_18110 [Cyanobacteria bacterium J06632_22]